MEKGNVFTYQSFLSTFFSQSTDNQKIEENPFEFGASISKKALKTAKLASTTTKLISTNKNSGRK